MRWRWVLAVLGLWACGDDGEPGPSEMDGGMMDGGPQRDLDATSTNPDAFSALPDGALGNGDLCARRADRVVVTQMTHVQGDVVYADPPPVGGNHNQCWAKWGVYEEPLADERWVHNLEHGGVVFLYRCPQGCRDEIDTMRVFVSGRTQALITPYDQLPTQFAVVAWGVRLMTNCFDMPAFEAFYRENVDNAPESLADDPPRACN